MSLKKMRSKANLTQSQLAVMSRVSYSTIIAYEQGTRDIENASYRTLKNIARVLKCEVKDLVK